MTLRLRNWQQQAVMKAIKWLVDEARDRHFLINAAPGAGKTICASVIAAELIQRKLIDRVIVIAPRSEVVSQWADDFRFVTGRTMCKVTAADGDIERLELDVCATWAAVQGLAPEIQTVCRSSRALVICDEHHHAAVQAAWGDNAESAFTDARYALILTGTPIRSDGAQSVWLAYDDQGAINHPEEGSYTLTYGEAVDLEYCRPVTFHRHHGRFTVDLEDGDTVEVSSTQKAKLPKELARIPGLQTALEFYKLAKTPQYAPGSKIPLVTGYQGTMFEWGSIKLDELRLRMPNAGGLVIAPSIEIAEYMADLIELMEGERPLMVHSQMPRPETKIRAFKHSDKRWLVSVAMVSEGVDIPRLRILMYLPSALTELAFRQAIGRVVRTAGPDDDTRAYVVMPSFETFEAYARRVEDEMSPATRAENATPRTKRCPACSYECQPSTSECPTCGYQFPAAPPRLKPCPDCRTLNPMGATACSACGASFGHHFTVTLDEALRTGAIVRGMDIDEQDVCDGEGMATSVRYLALKSGDEKLVKVLRVLPEESWARLRNILETGS